MNQKHQAEQLCNQSMGDWDQGLHEQAIKSMQQAVQLDSGNPRYRHVLASWHHALGNYDTALELLKQILRLVPRNAAAHQNLGLVYHALGRYHAAAACYRNSLAIDAESPAAHSNLGRVLQLLGDHDDAEQHFSQALGLQQDYPEALVGQAVLYELRGELDKAFALVCELLGKYPGNTELAIAYARLAPAHDKTEDAVQRLEQLICEPGTSLAKMQLHYSLADLHDKCGRFDQAFEHAQSANRLNPMRFDEQRYQDRVRSLKQIFDADTQGKILVANPEIGVATPLFVVGMPRSGTTLIEQILAAHPSVQTAGELTTISEMASDMQRRFATTHAYPGALNELSSENLDELAHDYCDRLSRDINDTDDETVWVIDKMPANFLHLGFIGRLFPQAFIIHCTRDPWDVSLSCYMRGFSGQGQAFSNDLGSIAVYYNGYRDLMAVWSKTVSNPVIDMKYEQLVAEPESEIGRILDTLRLDRDDACFRFYENTGVVATASATQVRKPIYRSSVGKAKNYRKWLEPALGDVMNPVMNKKI